MITPLPQIPRKKPSIESLSDAVLNEAGLELLKEKKYKEAEKVFRIALMKNPGNKFYYNNLAASRMKQEKYKEAHEALTNAIALDTVYVKALSNMAITCFHMYKFIDAYKYYRRAKKADSAYVKERFKKQKVAEEVNKTQKKDPNNEDMKKVLEYIDQEL